jgi:alcohol dehydrogenase class IV
MVEPFTLSLPRSIRFGPGERKHLPDLLRPFGRRILLLTGSGWFTRSAFRPDVERLLATFQVERLACPPGEPASGGLEELLRHGRRFRPDGILAIGGGSVLDSAKALSGLLPLEGGIEEYLEGTEAVRPILAAGVPWAAVPTTSGTGAECTANAVIRSERQKAKRSLRSPALLASGVVVDPELTLECPPSVSGTAGLDALTQQIESYVSRRKKPVPRALVRDALPGTLAALRRVASDPADLPARTGAAYGSMVSGIALANAGLGAAHGFAAGLGGLFEIPHGLICAVALGPVLRANGPLIAGDLKDLLGPAAGADPVEWLRAEVAELLRAFGLPRDLKGYGIDRRLIPQIARLSSGSSMSGNPRELDPQEREAILAELL